MSLPKNFVEELQFVHPKDFVNALKGEETRAHCTATWVLRNELRPVDIYCYLGARFGGPNGIQNILRADTSDNLIHWDWFLQYRNGLVQILGASFRTQIHILGLPEITYQDREAFIQQIKNDFQKHGHAMGSIRKLLEHWYEFINPYQRLKEAIKAAVGTAYIARH
jgi:hypothetical protein